MLQLSSQPLGSGRSLAKDSKQKFLNILALDALMVFFATAQQDTVVIPTDLRFTPQIRSLVVEASTLVLIAGSFGPTIDVDFLDIPYATVPHLGFRLSYQELSYGFLRLHNEHSTPIGIVRGGFLRGSHLTPKSRLDIFVGVAYWSSSTYAEGPQFLFGADIRSYILKPWSTFFVRILGNTRGVIVFLGITLGYDN